MKIATALRTEQYRAMWDVLVTSYRESGPDSEGYRAQVSLVAALFPVWTEGDIDQKVRSLSAHEGPVAEE